MRPAPDNDTPWDVRPDDPDRMIVNCHGTPLALGLTERDAEYIVALINETAYTLTLSGSF